MSHISTFKINVRNTAIISIVEARHTESPSRIVVLRKTPPVLARSNLDNKPWCLDKAARSCAAVGSIVIKTSTWLCAPLLSDSRSLAMSSASSAAESRKHSSTTCEVKVLGQVFLSFDMSQHCYELRLGRSERTNPKTLVF